MWAAVQDQDIIPIFSLDVPLLIKWILITAKIGQKEVGKWLDHIKNGSVVGRLREE